MVIQAAEEAVVAAETGWWSSSVQEEEEEEEEEEGEKGGEGAGFLEAESPSLSRTSWGSSETPGILVQRRCLAGFH